MTLTLSAAFANDDTEAKVSYTQPTSGSNNKLADKFGNLVASFADEEVALDSYPDVTVKFGGSAYTVAEDGSVSIPVNILVNARIREAPHHEVARAGLESALRGPEPLRISRQVMREYLAVVTRPQPWPVPITRGEALDDIGRLNRVFEVLEDGPRVPRRW